MDNALGRAKTKNDYVNWSYPSWWCYVTGALEIAAAALIAFPPTRLAGLILGALIIAAATVTVMRNRVYSDLPPLGIFVALLLLLGFFH